MSIAPIRPMTTYRPPAPGPALGPAMPQRPASVAPPASQALWSNPPLAPSLPSSPVAPRPLSVATLVAQATQSLYEHILRDVQNFVNDVNGYGFNIINILAGLQATFASPILYTIFLYLPKKIDQWIQSFSENPFFRFLQDIVKSPVYRDFVGVFSKVAPVIGLLCAPYDIRNLRQKWQDPKTSMFNKVCSTVQLGTGIMMCVGGILGFVLPWLGAPAAGAVAMNIAGKIGLVNLAASLPSIFDGVVSVFRWIGRQVASGFSWIAHAL